MPDKTMTSSSKTRFTGDPDFYRTLIRLTVTIALRNLIVYGVNLADNIMLGAYSEVSMSGVALVNQIQFLLQMLVTGAGEGVIVIASRAWGRGDTDEVKRASAVGMRFALAAAFVLFAAGLFVPRLILGLLAPSEAIVSEGARYMRIICFSYPVFAVTSVLLETLKSVESVRIGFGVSVAALFINVTLNRVFIYGFGFVPELGVRGAALATLIARICELVIVLIYIKQSRKRIAIRFADYLKLDRPTLSAYLRVSLPVMLSSGMWGIAQATQTGILGRIGDSAVGANSIAATVFSILTVVAYGSASATSVIIGKAIGEGKDACTVQTYANTLQVIFLCIGAVTGLGLFLFKNFIIGFYRVTPETRSLALAFMTVLSVTVVGTSYQMATLTGIVRGGGDTSFVLKNDMIFMWLIVIPSAALSAFVFELSPVVVFACLKCDQILKCAVAVVKVNRRGWIKKVGGADSPSSH